MPKKRLDSKTNYIHCNAQEILTSKELQHTYIMQGCFVVQRVLVVDKSPCAPVSGCRWYCRPALTCYTTDCGGVREGEDVV